MTNETRMPNYFTIKNTAVLPITTAVLINNTAYFNGIFYTSVNPFPATQEFGTPPYRTLEIRNTSASTLYIFMQDSKENVIVVGPNESKIFGPEWKLAYWTMSVYGSAAVPIGDVIISGRRLEW